MVMLVSAALAGVLAGGAVVASWSLRRRPRKRPVEMASAPSPSADDDGELQPGVEDVLAVLRSIGIVLDESDAVMRSTQPAIQHGLVREGELVHRDLVELARQVRSSGEIREAELDLPRGPLGRGRMVVHVRAARLSTGHVLLLVEDRTHASRVDEVRRDFVANVSHELKTPVGGLVLLAEAIQDAADDPEAVERFAGRMIIEAERLTLLVKEIVDLSRLQVADTLTEPVPVDVSGAAADAADRCQLVAEGKGITIEVTPCEGAVIFGDRELLTTAIRNLVDNAVAYSGEGTPVRVVVSRTRELVDVVVSDLGSGIPADEQDRVFERFYRVDPARSRSTGGTGLGLSIVKHVVANHGGEVRLWSREGQGSTFTLSFPAAGLADLAAGAGPQTAS
ncbi:sensor histidine kinase [Arsenicicoccus sp. oral taxon 190]|uniref:sensor histidine kinase n=1 Tax=Arsenicicoccus sp. oral taxon 190 TaxID=1658671 RepID=UPI00067A18BA|nr:ATP-binding protein [Arsenicicoccus sp. oral taxon 190]AKT52497.1 histidine kinase [Arsenicicoccus sp. oral taxon 190]